MSVTGKFITGLGVGAGLMYFTDPDRGRRRRALVRDRFYSFFARSGRGLDKAWRDASNRSQGIIAEARRLAWGAGEAPDDVLAARVRSKLGRVSSHPHAIRVTARDGEITLEGPVLVDEQQRIVDAVRGVSGVREVHDRTQAFASSADISALQGGSVRCGDLPEYTQENWTPALRAGAGIVGGYLVLKGMIRGGLLGRLTTLAGAGVIVRAAANVPPADLIGARGHAIAVHKTVNVCAPVEEVYSFWMNYRNFPRFMTHLAEVRDLGDGRSRWVAEGPAGARFSWEAEIVENVPNRVIAWRSVPGSEIENRGSVRFDTNPDGTTRITVRLFYAPPAGMLGHAVAALFRRDPRHELDDDLARLKSLIEFGKTHAHGEKVLMEDLGYAPPPAQ